MRKMMMAAKQTRGERLNLTTARSSLLLVDGLKIT